METNVIKDPIERLRAYADNMDSILVRIDKSDVLMGIADEMESGYMKLPVDADGVPIRPGDELIVYGGTRRRCFSVTERLVHSVDDTGSRAAYLGRDCRHVKPDTVEILLQELADEV